MRIAICTAVLLLLTPIAVFATNPPTSSLSVSGIDTDGFVTFTLAYTFDPNSSQSARSVLVFNRDRGAESYISEHPAQPSGSISATIDTTCWHGGTYRIVGYASDLNGGRSTEQTVTMSVPDKTPQVSLDVSPPDDSGIVTISADYNFPATKIADQRYLIVCRTGGSFHFCDIFMPSSEVVGGTGVPQQSGTAVATVDTSCWTPGTYGWHAFAKSCSGDTATDDDDTDVTGQKPKVSITLVKHLPSDPNDLNYDAQITYKFLQTSTQAQRTVSLDRLPGKLGGGANIFSFQPPTPSGTQIVSVGPVTTYTNFQATAKSTHCSPASIVKDVAGAGPSCPNCVGSPVLVTTGSMQYDETDPLPQQNVLRLGRSYDTNNTSAGLFGAGWTSLLDTGLATWGSGDDQVVVISTEGHTTYVFFKVNGQYTQHWPKGTSVASTLSGSTSAGFTFREGGSGTTRSFSGTGRLLKISSVRDGRDITITYDSNSLPTRVDDSWGTVALLITTTTGRITQIAVDGRPDIFWTYQYSSNLLTAVLAPDNQPWRQYTYDNGRLSAVHDSLGNLIESHAYDTHGWATSSIQSADDVQTVSFNQAGRVTGETLTQVTYASGRTVSYYVRGTAGALQTVEVRGGCSSCSGHSEDVTYAFDSFAHVTREQDGRGYVRESTYDSNSQLASMRGPLKPSGCDPQTDTNHCRMTTDDLAATTLDTTSLTKTTTYVYGNTTWPDLPTLMTTTSVANPSNTKSESIVYDTATGQPLIRTETGCLDLTHQETHTTTTALYNGTEGTAFTPGGPFDSSWLTLAQPAGLRKSIDGPRTDVSDVTTFVYYPVNSAVTSTWRGRLAAVRNALGHITTYSDYDVFGNAQTVIDPNNVATKMTDDTLGRLLTSKIPAIPGCDTALDPTCASDIISSRLYSPGGGPLSTDTKPLGGVTGYTYDGRGRVASIQRTVSATPPLSERIEYDYDPATGQKSAERVLDNSSGPFVVKKSVAYFYDTNGRLTQALYPDAAKVVYTYDVAGALESVQDENHAIANTSYKYNETGAVREVDQTLLTGQITTAYDYDVHGNLTKVTDPNGNLTSYKYDDFGRMTGQTSPVTGTTTYTYDLGGNLLTSVDANAATTTRIYDELSRVLSAASARSGAATETVTWVYDNVSAGSYDLGRLSAANDPTGSVVMRYDHRGNLRQEQRVLGGVAYYWTSYTYDADGNRSSISYPSGRVVNYLYDLAGRPLSAASGGTTYASGAAYLPYGPLASFNFGNGAKRAMTFDSRYRITENKLFNPPNTIARYSYLYDAGENIKAIQDLVDASYTRNFDYDDLNRLTAANTGSSLWGTGSNVYDAMGNLTSRSLGTPPVDTGQPLSMPGRPFRATTTVTGQVDRLAFTFAGATPNISVVTANGLDHTVTYDAAGNETSYLANRTYSARNLMNAVADTSGEGPAHQITYGYDWRGVRVSRTETPTDAGSASRYFFYSPELQLLESTIDDSNNVWGQSTHHITSTPLVANRDIIWFNGVPVAEIGPARTPDNTPLSNHRTFTTALEATNTFWTFTDHLGIPLIQMDNTTAIVWRAEHEPYGNVWLMRKGARTDQPLRFPGQELAMTWEGGEESYNIFRWYRSSFGRFIQSDPLGLVPTTLGVKNLSAYADANPVDHSDRLGLYSIDKKCADSCGPDNVTSCYGNPQKINCIKGLIEQMKQKVFFDSPCKKALQAADKWQQVAGSLMPSAPYPKLTCNKADCVGSSPYYVPVSRSIPMCKWFFAYAPPAGAQSMLHEFLHDAQVGDGTPEQTSILTACFPGMIP